MRCTPVFWLLLALPAACSHAARPGAVVPEEPGIVLIVENTTIKPLQVYFIEQKTHTRIGEVAPSSSGRLLVRNSLLGNRTWFRIYAFRGIEPCPVARVIDASISRTPRIIVTATDTVASGELLGDACRRRS